MREMSPLIAVRKRGLNCGSLIRESQGTLSETRSTRSMARNCRSAPHSSPVASL